MSHDLIKELREITGAGLMDVKEALESSDHDKEKALEHLRKKGIAKLAKKADRITKDGLIETYIHPGNKLGVLLEINCETDFVSRTDDFKQLAKDIALHIAAGNPLYISREQVPPEVIEKEQEIAKAQGEGKPEDVVSKMIVGKLEKYYEEVCLMEQSFIKNPEIRISQLIAEAVGKMGENIQVKRFSRFVLGSEN